MYESEYLYGIHEPGGEELILAAGRTGWVVFTGAVGHNPADRSGIDFREYSERGLGVICRINNGYEPHGTIPHSSLYEAFARRVANFVGTSQGCKIWVIANETNYAVERPGIQIDWSRHPDGRSRNITESDPLRHGLAVRFNVLPDHSDEIRTTRAAIVSQGEMITPELYARCYRLCRDAIHLQPGHEDDEVLIGAVAPWNTQTTYPGNPNGDWVQYFREILEILGPQNCDGFTLHTYTHGPDPNLIASDTKLPSPFQNYHQEFRAYIDFMLAVPPSMRHLPVYITETDQSGPWSDENSGWVQKAYAEIDRWNQQESNQVIRALCLYRWPRHDLFYIAGKQGVIHDFSEALQAGYRWAPEQNQINPLSVDQAAAFSPSLPLARPEPVKSDPIEGTDLIEAGQSLTESFDAPSARSSDAVTATVGSLSTPIRQTNTEEKENRSTSPHSTTPEATLEQHPQANQIAQMAEQSLRPYQVEWLDDEFPTQLIAGSTIEATLSIRNIGSLTWNWGGTHPYRLGYHYYRNRRLLPLSRERDLRSDIPHDVAPGESVTLRARIALPEEAGNYTIELDLIHEGVTRFKEQNSRPLTRWLTVESPDVYADLDGNGIPPDGQTMPVPLFTDVVTRLPRGRVAYARRNLDQIQFIVVSHTGATPQLGIDLIAQTHIQSGYPGIAYTFVIDQSGQIFKVSALEEVAQPDQVWSSEGVNICFAGDFNVEPPSMLQLDAAGRLCAWLTQNLDLSIDSILGLGELTSGSSPGLTFYHGPCWKEILTRQVQLNLAILAAGTESDRYQTLRSEMDELDRQKSELESQLQIVQSEREKLRLVNEQLQQENAQLRRDLETIPQDIESGIRIRNIIEQLPRDAELYVERRLSDVEFIVINHTGVDPDTSLKNIAQAHRADWPGLLYDFVIDGQGNIFQSQPLNQVVSTEQPYLSNAVNVAFAGEFSQVVPTDEQLYSGGQLLSWLLGRFPNIPLENIKGIGEFIDHTSPGRQWIEGQKWKEMLLASVRRATGIYDPNEVEKELRSQLVNIEHQVQILQRDNQAIRDQSMNLESQNQRLQLELNERDETPTVFRVPEPSMRSVVEQLPRHPSLRYEARALSQISHLAVHHTATPPTVTPQRIAELHVNADPSRGKEAWPGIGYHYFVYPDGLIEQVNPLEIVSYHVYRHNQHSVGIVFAGSFMNGKVPTPAQIRSGAHLLAWLMQELKIPLARVWGHREFPDNMTVCPGNEWSQGNRWRDLLFERIEQVQDGIGLKSIPHYLLFWQRPYPGPLARQDFVNAFNYIERFRPMIGFSVTDAKNAEYVTIVGNESGINAFEERTLRNAGCQVERIAGRDEEETARILSELARLNRRFRDFDVDF
ncbi:N-acetylmuramoyl-L-alanine amidase [Chloroflexi bacterium TSY]|nr:N-acetylmuramoyl-L-alanine amidase [Chloroflexi bacterium TSY]